MQTLILYPIVGYVLHYLLARAMITRALWSKYPPWLDTWTSCAACSGSWLTGFAALTLGIYRNWTFFDIAATNPISIILAIIWGMYWVPVLAHLHCWCMNALYSDGD